ncbi:hypothetical protein EDC02_2854 [Micromonospora sp. Llam0]|uniref:DUF6346 domain-containing protein n=1 Tax=Micromonospora sp. Llam0 TaxID=2485143 RepID=UPI000F92681B|nr:DUF6346 domain-containing protein [Micromonospora sp. Llam0]ROO60935.1 hypothetical protein EDC02_2854 [Micromonospora sp. Llam0]
MLYRLRQLFFMILTLAVASVFLFLYLTVISLYPGTGVVRPYGPIEQSVQVKVEECRRVGPVSDQGLGYWWVCRLLIERDNGRTVEAVVGGSVVTPKELGRVVTIREACRDPGQNECAYGKPVSRVLELLYGVFQIFSRVLGVFFILMSLLYLLRVSVGAPTYFLLLDKWRGGKGRA